MKPLLVRGFAFCLIATLSRLAVAEDVDVKSHEASPITGGTSTPENSAPAAAPVSTPAVQGSHATGPGGLPMTTFTPVQGPLDPRTASVDPSPSHEATVTVVPVLEPALQAGPIITPGVAYTAPAGHVAAETLARGHGYNGGRLDTKVNEGDANQTRNADILSIKGDAPFRENLQKDGYTLLDATDDRQTGFQATVVKDGKGEVTIIFRGTEPTAEYGADLFADAHGNVGIGQYEGAKDVMDQWAKDYPNARVTGHSLGAALGQHYVHDHPEAVKEAILFNVPGISQEAVDDYNKSDGPKPPITIYVASGDLVSEMGGEAHLPSTVVMVHGGNVDPGTGWIFPDDPENGAAPYHTGTMLQPDSRTSLNTIPFDEYQQGREPTLWAAEPFEDFLEGVKVAEDDGVQLVSDFWGWLTGSGEKPAQVVQDDGGDEVAPSDSSEPRSTFRPTSNRTRTVRPPRIRGGDCGKH